MNEDFFTRTLSGGVITIVASVLMSLLFLSELRLYLRLDTQYELTVDTSRGEQVGTANTLRALNSKGPKP